MVAMSYVVHVNGVVSSLDNAGLGSSVSFTYFSAVGRATI